MLLMRTETEMRFGSAGGSWFLFLVIAHKCMYEYHDDGGTARPVPLQLQLYYQVQQYFVLYVMM